MKALTVRPLTKAAFAPFGTVIETDGAESFLINEGTTRRFHELAELDVADKGGRPILSVFEADKRIYPLEIKMVERHPLGSQAFVPLMDAEWLVVVAKGENPRPESCEAFLARGSQGVQYNKGVWHHPLLAILDKHQFLVVDRAGEGENLEEFFFKDADVIVVQP